ncbi:MAG: hypothetical protein WAV54_08205 [Acidimicrobiales bacterium]
MIGEQEAAGTDRVAGKVSGQGIEDDSGKRDHPIARLRLRSSEYWT